MSCRVVRASFGKGKYKIRSIATVTSQGITVCLVGGQKPHVGAVSIGIPRQSLRDPSKISVSSSVFTLTGHKDDEIARPVSEKISKELNQVVVVVAGIHVDKATEEDIKRLTSNSMHAVEILVRKLRSAL